MTLTDRALEWLDGNRNRSYPIVDDEWREAVRQSSGLDCVVLDALIFDTDASGENDLVLESIRVEADRTTVSMKYSGAEFSVNLVPSVSDPGFETIRMSVPIGERNVSVSMSFSSHGYIKENVGTGFWTVGCRFLKSRVVSVNNGVGVAGISSEGSAGVEGHANPATADGEVVLEDGYRTSPIIWNGDVFVRVGRRYGLDPCKYDYGESGTTDCRKPLFFFCGQNAINGGNIAIKGGRGISVEQGRTYTVRDQKSRLYGKSIPCIEIVAGDELSSLYSPN